MSDRKIIYVDDAINTLNSKRVSENNGHKWREYRNDNIDMAIEIIQSLPPAQPKPQWIPVSERLPDKPNMYTVTDSKGDVVRFVFYDNENSRTYWRRCVRAWMPLPEPYTERREG